MGDIGYESPNLPRRNFQILTLQVVYPKDLPLLSDWPPEVFGQRLELTLQDSWGPGNIPVMLEILVCWDNFRGLDSLDSWVVAVSHALVSWRWPESDYLLRPQIHYIAVSWPGGGMAAKSVRRFLIIELLCTLKIAFTGKLRNWEDQLPSLCTFYKHFSILIDWCIESLTLPQMYADIVGLEQAMKRVDASPGMLSSWVLWLLQRSTLESWWCLSCLATQMPMAGEPKSSSTAGPGAQKLTCLKALILASWEKGHLGGIQGKAQWFKTQVAVGSNLTKSPQFESFFIIHLLPITSSCQEWEEQEIPWAELIWVLVFHRSFGRCSWFVHIGPWCQWMHQVDPFELEGCLKQTRLETTCKDHEGHISAHEMTCEFTWLMCL